MEVLYCGLSLAEGSKNLRKLEWRLLLVALLAEGCRSEVSERVEHGIIVAYLEEVPLSSRNRSSPSI